MDKYIVIYHYNFTEVQIRAKYTVELHEQLERCMGPGPQATLIFDSVDGKRHWTIRGEGLEGFCVVDV